jgi:putative oxidoreductase
MRVRYIPSLPGKSMTSESLRNPVAMKSTPASLSDWAEVIGRIGLALLFLWSGYEKLAHPASTVAYMQAYALPAADLLMWPALLLELAGGAMLALGWKLRWMALVLAGYTFAATFVFHAYWSAPADQVMNEQIHFMSNLAIAGGLLLVFAHGSGRYALDKS